MDLGLTFSQGEVSNDGKELELIPGGANILVTEENKLSYIELIIEWKYIGSIQKKLDIITNAFEEVMPVIFLDIFTTAEIELVLCGQKKIDIDDWEKNTNYFSGYTSNSTQIKWFWAFLRQSNEEIQSRMLQFVTGTSSVPLEGFANLKSQKDTLQFSIKKVPFKSKYNAALPVSHACFNSLELPDYPTYEMLVKKLTLALTETDTFELK
ncbi:MAG: WW domain containing E3 ubiquitin protein ligase 1 [Paramarteilia canceri]